MLTFIFPFLVGTIFGFLIRGKPSDTFAMTTGRRVAWAIGFGFGGLLIGMPIGLAISPTTGSQIAGLIATGLWLGVFNMLSIENATYKNWSERKVFAWACGAIVALPLLASFLPNEIRGVFPSYERNPVTESPVPSVTADGQVEQAPAQISIERGSFSQQAVDELRRGIREGSFWVVRADVDVISEEQDVFSKPWNRYRERLSDGLLSTLEDKNFWWVENGRSFYLRLYNPSPTPLWALVFSLSDTCGVGSPARILLSVELKKPLAPYSYGMYLSYLPFDFDATVGSGTKCGVVTMALAQK